MIRASAEPTKVAPPAAGGRSECQQDQLRPVRRSRPEREGRGTRGKAGRRQGCDAHRLRHVRGAAAQSASCRGHAATAAHPPSVLTEPKKVRTVTIRPDAPDNSVARPPMVTPPAPAAPTRQAAAAPSNAPLDLANPASPPQQARAAAVRQTPPPAVRPAPAPTSANAPLSLAPENAPLPPPGTARRSRADARGRGSGRIGQRQLPRAGFVAAQRGRRPGRVPQHQVQVFERARRPSAGDPARRPGGKGTYYRAMVGPFTTRDQAIQLCSSLKAAGGDCVVQAN